MSRVPSPAASAVRVHSRTRAGVSSPRRRRGSVLVIVLVTIVFATTALLVFMERASTDLMVHVRDADRLRLRQEAYSALETTLAVLVDFEEVLGGLHSPAEGWAEPLEWIGYEPADGMAVEVHFEDESGKISIARVDFQTLYDLFIGWERTEDEAELWADAIMGWMSEEYEPRSFNAPEPADYERDTLPFAPPGRPLRSFAELRAIDVIREDWFDEDGHPNEFARRFMAAVSLFDFQKTNVNAASGQVLSAIGRYDQNQQDLMEDYRRGDGIYRGRGQGYFTSQDELRGVLGEAAGANGFGVEIQALRVAVTVRQGQSSYRLNVVISPGGGARVAGGDPLPRKEGNTGRSGGATDDPAAAASGNDSGGAEGGGAAQRHSPAALAAAEGDDSKIPDIEYPFTLLEIREIDAPPRLAETSLSPET